MATPATPVAAPARPLTETTVCLQIRLGGLGSRAKLDSGRVQLKQSAESTEIAERQPDAEFLHVSKEILRSPELANVRSQAGEIRQFVLSRSLPSILRGGIYLVPVALVPEIEQRLEQMKAVRRGLISEFIEAYPRIKDEARRRLGDAFDEADYPSVDRVRAAHTMDVRYLTFSTPTSLRRISEDLFRREQQKAERAWAVATEEITTLLRAEFKGLVEHMADRLAPAQDGKPKVFRNTLVTNLADFLSTFHARNVTNDAELGSLVERARDMLRGVTDAQQLRDNDSLRGQMADTFGSMRQQLNTMVTARPSRLISFSEE